MKTKKEVYEWLRQHDWYQSFRINTVRNSRMLFDEYISKCFDYNLIATIISGAFSWYLTNQGYDYWDKINKEYREWLNTDNTDKIMKQTIEIEVPEGKKAVWKDGKVVFKDIMPELPRTWEEFCTKYPLKKGEAYITDNSDIGYIYVTDERFKDLDRNALSSKEAAEAHLALMQLHQLRDCYRQGWVPDWEDKNQDKYYIANSQNLSFGIYRSNDYVHFLSFPMKAMAKDFLHYFEDLIRKAGDLIG